jgi:DNA-binding MarR family transcriptional regulator
MPELDEVADELATGVSLLRRRLRQLPATEEASDPEIAALSRLDRGGPATNSDLARAERISPQSMNSTLAGLEARGLVVRSTDPADRRRVVLTLTEAGLDAVRHRRAVRRQQIAAALSQLAPEEVAALHAAAPVFARLADVL